MAYVNPVPGGPVAGAWYLANAAGVALPAPVAPESGLWLVVGAVPAATAPVCRVTVGDWSAVVQSEGLSDFGAGTVGCWRRLWVVSDSAPPAAGEPVLAAGVPVDVVSLEVLALAVGVDTLGDTERRELLRLRGLAVAEVDGVVARGVLPGVLLQSAVARVVGYLLDRPSSAGSAWRASGAASLCAEWVEP